MVKVKICGITNPEDAEAAVDYGADALGFIFVKSSPRYILPEQAAAIIRVLPPFITAVGVFADEAPATVEKIISETGINLVQLHGSEPPDACSFSRRVIKAIRVRTLHNLEPLVGFKDKVAAFLLDTYDENLLGGTGHVFNWDIAVEAKRFGRIILAGGLTHANIGEAVKRVRPYAVDVSSGVEKSKGRKDHKKLKLFIETAKSA